MKSLKGTQTERNILTAFAGESQARNRYDYFAGAAKKDGFVQIADIFTETALQEKEHAKRLFKFLEGGDVEITAAFPAGIITGTEANLYAAAAGEHHEYTEMYPSFANIADSEGFSEVACVMRNIAIAEQYHEERFLAFAKNIKEGRVFVRETPRRVALPQLRLSGDRYACPGPVPRLCAPHRPLRSAPQPVVSR